MSETGCPSKAKARGEVGLVREDEIVTEPVIPHKGKKSRRIGIRVKSDLREILIGVTAAGTNDNGGGTAKVHIDHGILKVVPIGSNLVTEPEIQGEIAAELEIVLNVIGPSPAEEMNMGVAGGHFGVVADAEEHGSQREAGTGAIGIQHGLCRKTGIGKSAPRDVVRKEV